MVDPASFLASPTAQSGEMHKSIPISNIGISICCNRYFICQKKEGEENVNDGLLTSIQTMPVAKKLGKSSIVYILHILQ